MTAPTTRTIHGDCLHVMAEMEPNSIDAIVTDPPYGLSFMGKEWDHGVPGVPFWEAALRVLKPGGHLVAFSGSRTYHRLACAVEDAGFEIRDSFIWMYGSGFPKSMDISKAIDKAAGAEREVVGTNANSRPAKRKGGAGFDAAVGGEALGSILITTPATPEAQQWNGWGTALKPAHEPAVIARKPLSAKTVAANVLTHGTGGLNIDGCRIGAPLAYASGGFPERTNRPERKGREEAGDRAWARSGEGVEHREVSGRWPANIAHDGSDEVVGLFPQTDGQVGMTTKTAYRFQPGEQWDNGKQSFNKGTTDTGSAARFFYTSKASRSERNHGLNMLECVSVEVLDAWENVVQQVRLQVDTAQSPPRVIAESGTVDATAWSTVLFGSSTTDPFPMGCKSITETVTSSTTLLKTLKSSMLSRTSESTAAVSTKRAKHTSHVESAANLSTWSLSFTSEKAASLPGVGNVASGTRLKINGKGKRSGNFHSTVKPLDLMAYICRLITPPGGIVLDPFCGSGTTLKAALSEGFSAIGIEKDAAYFEIIESRMDGAQIGLGLGLIP